MDCACALHWIDCGRLRGASPPSAHTASLCSLSLSARALILYLSLSLRRLLNKCEPGAVDELAVAKAAGGVSKNGVKASINAFANVEVMNLFLDGCRRAGLELGNVGSADFQKADQEHKEHLILGVVWQLLRRQLANEIKDILRQEAEAAARAAEEAAAAAGRAVDDEQVQELMQERTKEMDKALKDPETFLCDWVNTTLDGIAVEEPALAGLVKSVGDLSTEKTDVLAKLAHGMAPTANSEAALAAEDGMSRAAYLVEWAAEQGIPSLTQADDLRDGNPRLILPFVMSMFTWHHATKGEAAAAEAAAAAGGAAHTELRGVYVVRQHWHVPAAEDGSSAGSCTSNTICAFKAEADALR